MNATPQLNAFVVLNSTTFNFKTFTGEVWRKLCPRCRSLTIAKEVIATVSLNKGGLPCINFIYFFQNNPSLAAYTISVCDSIKFAPEDKCVQMWQFPRWLSSAIRRKFSALVKIQTLTHTRVRELSTLFTLSWWLEGGPGIQQRLPAERKRRRGEPEHLAARQQCISVSKEETI